MLQTRPGGWGGSSEVLPFIETAPEPPLPILLQPLSERDVGNLVALPQTLNIKRWRERGMQLLIIIRGPSCEDL